uniref:Reverse transcriptase zinc-binding domain-containing protein n=1 Tax=Aegilops tauschii TaxID=37682 RepID=R7VYI8_AEGTA
MEDGNVVKVLKGIDGSPVISTSSDDLICMADYSYSYASAQVIDPASGKVLVDCPKQQNRMVVKVDDGSACKVFTLGEDTGWRVSEPPQTKISYMENSPVTVNGVMYFLETQHRRGYTLHCFDIESEAWRKTISGSHKPMGPDVCLAVLMAELNGALCMVQTEREYHTPMTNNRRANIWILADLDMGTWIKAYSIPMDASTDYCRPLRVTRDGGKLIFCNAFYGHFCLDTFDGKFFVWTLLQNRLWTADRLLARRWDHNDACSGCDQTLETAKHLILECPFAKEVWFRASASFPLAAQAASSASSINSVVVAQAWAKKFNCANFNHYKRSSNMTYEFKYDV